MSAASPGTGNQAGIFKKSRNRIGQIVFLNKINKNIIMLNISCRKKKENNHV